MIETRYQLPKLIDQLQLTKFGVEIGVANGSFSATLLSSSINKLYSVDSWDANLVRSEWTQPKMDNLYEEAKKKLLPFGERSEIIRDFSVNAAKRFEDKFFDFVYIDASHDYKSVKDDIEAWWPKVKSGGILSGHDYFVRENDDKEWGVIIAVDEFIKKNRLQLFLTKKDIFTSWFTFKRQTIFM